MKEKRIYAAPETEQFAIRTEGALLVIASPLNSASLLTIEDANYYSNEAW